MKYAKSYQFLAYTNLNNAFRNSSLAGTFIVKSYSNLYDKLCSFDNLFLAYRKARKGKGSKWYVREFEKDMERNLILLETELRSLTYSPKPLRTFVIRDPKTRVISASNFRDRVVHHALCNIIEPIFEKTFIYDSYANRKNKGTHAALKRFDEFKRNVSQGGRPVNKTGDNSMVCGYALKADIKHYFDSVDHNILMEIISRKIADEKILWLIRKILDNHETRAARKGMPIGNLTSQFFANVYLNELDYFVKHKLRTKYYIRYVDDFVILHSSKEVLELCKTRINEFLTSIKLELHPEKTKIYPLHHGVNLLGFRIFYFHKLPYRRNVRQFEKKLEILANLYDLGVISEEHLAKRVEGWLAYAMHGNTYKMRKGIAEKLQGQCKFTILR